MSTYLLCPRAPVSSTVKNVYILAISLCILHNYFNSLTTLFSDMYLVKFLDVSAKLFFP